MTVKITLPAMLLKMLFYLKDKEKSGQVECKYRNKEEQVGGQEEATPEGKINIQGMRGVAGRMRSKDSYGEEMKKPNQNAA